MAIRIPTAPRGVILAGCTALQLCLGTVYAWSFFQSMLVEQFGWSWQETAWAFSITIFSLGISAAWAGIKLPRLGPRKLALAGSVMFCGGYLIGSLALQMDNLMLFYVGHGVMGGAGIGFGYVTPVATASKWFPDHKGIATGTTVMGFGVGALLLSKVLAPFLVVQTQHDLTMVFFWLGIIFACILIPVSLLMEDPPTDFDPTKSAGEEQAPVARPEVEPAPPVKACLTSPEFAIMWIVFFFNIAAGISVISFQSPLLQDVWGLADPALEPEVLAEYGATLIAVTSLCNGIGRLLWGLLSDRIGRVRVFQILLGSQVVVFGILMTETNPWIFSILVCYILLCFGGGFATMPSFVTDVFGSERMSAVYGTILTAWSAAGVFGPLYVGYLKDQYPDRAVTYCFLIGVVMLVFGYIFTFLLRDDRIRISRPTVESTLQEFGVEPRPRAA